MRKLLSLCLLLSLQCFICGCNDSDGDIINSFSTGVLTGRVTDLEGNAVEGAAITVSGTTAESSTGSDGTFALNAPSGEQTLSATKVGFVHVQRKVTVPENVNVSTQPISVSFVLPPQQTAYAAVCMNSAREIYTLGQNVQLELSIKAGDTHGLRLVGYDVRVKRDGNDLWSEAWKYPSPETIAPTNSHSVNMEWDWSKASINGEFVNCMVEAKAILMVDIASDNGALPLPIKGSLAGQFIEYEATKVSFSLDNRP